RTTMCLPERGRIGIFNRSYYEEVLVVRAHPEILARQRLPSDLVTKKIWEQRFEDIRAFERYLARNGTLILKFFLHVSKEEQRKRFLERLDDPDKRWKFSMGDVAERKLWDDYMTYYEEMIRATSRPEAPWFVVPADKKWFTRLAVAGAMVDAMERLELLYPKVPDATLREMREVRAALAAEDSGSVRGKSSR
ncbi:MAG: polyphosphate kinase 2 family protein, partial [Rhizobiales bacterium]|nr:polyphosphate kinase 2 family protein [Hyphomicrobiales bacterium]